MRVLGRRWLTAVVSLGLALLLSGTGLVAGSFLDSETSVANAFQAWTSTQWLQTTQADFEAGVVPIRVDTHSTPGDVGLARTSGVLAFQGGTANFWRYGVTDDLWASRASPPAPNTVGAGGALAYDGTRYVYAFRGGGQTTFWRYDTTSNTWMTLTATSAAVNNGGALACVGTTYVYALHGNGTTTFRRYRIALGNWQNRNNTPATVGAGGALVYDGTRYMYAFRGGGQTTFWRYDTVGNTWTPMTAAPSAVNAGGALAYDGSGYIYAFRGGAQNAIWRYDVLNNVWAVMAVAPGNVAAGGALAFVAVNTYVGSATIASQVRDTGVAGARWDALFWDETLPANTDITFEVRASDTLFLKDAVTPAWTPVGGTSPISSGLPSGRYMQWRATLTTSNAAVTPLLREVRLYHY